MSYKAREMVWRRGKRPVYVRTVFGSERFDPDVPVLVAPRLQQDALARGIEYVDEAEIDQPRTPEPDPVDPYERGELIEEAIRILIAEGNEGENRDKFSANGLPKMRAIAKQAGLEKIGENEIRPVFEKIARERQDEKLEQDRIKAKKREETTRKIKEGDTGAAPKKKVAAKKTKVKKANEPDVEDC